MWWLWTGLLLGLVGCGGRWLAESLWNQPRGWPGVLAAAALAWCGITLGVIVTGTMGVLNLAVLGCWSLAFFLAALALRFFRPRGEPPILKAAGTAWDATAVVALGLLIWPALVLGMQSLLLAVKVVSDGPIYHLYFAARWWKAGRLFFVPTPFGENAAPYFPANGDLWFTWLFTCWQGDRLAKVGQVPFLLLAAMTAFAIARRLGAGPSAAVVAVAWFVTCSPLFLFSFEANVDTIFAAAYLLAVYFLIRYALDQPDSATLSLAGLAAGGALGTKAPGILFVPPVLVLGLIVVARQNLPARRRWVHAGVLVGSTLVLSAFWYIRNAWLTGNPLYPLHVAALGRTWLAGWYGSDVMRLSQYYLPLTDWRAGVDILLAVLDPRLVPLWILALGGAWFVRNRQEAIDRAVWLCALGAVLNVLIFWWLIPYRTQQRFMLHAVGLAAIPLARLLDRSKLVRWVAVVLLALHVLTPQPWPLASREADIVWDASDRIPNMVYPFIALPLSGSQWSEALARPGGWFAVAVTLGMGAGAFLAAGAWARWTWRPARGRLIFAGAISLALAIGAGCVVYPWQVPSRWLFYPAFPDYNRGWAALERLSPPEGTRVAYAGTNLPYYLMCAGLRNDVSYVNIDTHRGWLLHDYHRQARGRGQPTWPHPRPGWDRIHPEYAAWLANLRALGIAYLVVARANPAEGPHNVADAQNFPIERVWAEAHPDAFTPVYGIAERDPLFRIYRVRD